MSRVLALVGAIAMIAVAIVVRGALDDDGDGSGRRDDDGGAPVIVCITELEAGCPAGSRVEEANITADRLIDGDHIDAWLTFDPWPAIVDEGRDRAQLEPLFLDRTAVASARLAVLGPAELDGCDWACLVTEPELRIGTRPLDSGLGLLHLGVIASSIVGTADFATNDLVPSVRAALSAAIDSTLTDARPVLTLLRSPAFFDAALALDAEASSALLTASPDRSEGLAVLYPSPVAHAVVVAAGDASVFGDLQVVFGGAGSGWAEGSVDPGLPNPGVMAALRALL